MLYSLFWAGHDVCLPKALIITEEKHYKYFTLHYNYTCMYVVLNKIKVTFITGLQESCQSRPVLRWMSSDRLSSQRNRLQCKWKFSLPDSITFISLFVFLIKKNSRTLWFFFWKMFLFSSRRKIPVLLCKHFKKNKYQISLYMYTSFFNLGVLLSSCFCLQAVRG